MAANELRAATTLLPAKHRRSRTRLPDFASDHCPLPQPPVLYQPDLTDDHRLYGTLRTRFVDRFPAAATFLRDKIVLGAILLFLILCNWLTGYGTRNDFTNLSNNRRKTMKPREYDPRILLGVERKGLIVTSALQGLSRERLYPWQPNGAISS